MSKIESTGTLSPSNRESELRSLLWPRVVAAAVGLAVALSMAVFATAAPIQTPADDVRTVVAK